MISAITKTPDAELFTRLQNNAPEIRNNIQNLKNMGLSQKDLLISKLGQLFSSKDPAVIAAAKDMIDKLSSGKPLAEASFSVKSFLPNDAAIKETSVGLAVMAEGWERPVVFSNGVFKAWIDDPYNVSTNDLWQLGYGQKPDLIMGAVGNSNIKPEQVKGGCSMNKKELSAKYEQAIEDFFNPIVNYLKEQGAKAEDIGFAFAHSDCGVDRAARNVIDKQDLKGFGVTPTQYTQYLRGVVMPATEEFPNGYVLADFNYPTVLTRNISQIEDYANVYGKLVGCDNPLGVFGGGEHAFIRDSRESLIGQGYSKAIPVDIMYDKFGIEIPAAIKNDDDKMVVTNAARDILERVNGNPYEQFRYAFSNFLPSSKLKEDLAQYDPQAAYATVAYSQLAKAGKIGK